jgi:fatty acid desaturase
MLIRYVFDKKKAVRKRLSRFNCKSQNGSSFFFSDISSSRFSRAAPALTFLTFAFLTARAACPLTAAAGFAGSLFTELISAARIALPLFIFCLCHVNYSPYITG